MPAKPMSEREFLTEAHADDLEGALKAFLRSHGFHDAAALVGTELDDARQEGYRQGIRDGRATCGHDEIFDKLRAMLKGDGDLDKEAVKKLLDAVD